MKLFQNRFGLAFSFLICAPIYASAQEVEKCLPVLEPDTYQLDKQTETNLFLLDKQLNESKDQKDTDVFAKYGDASLDFGQSKAASARLEKLLEINYSNREKINLYISTLSDAAAKSYRDCLATIAKTDLAFTFGSNILESNAFYLQLDWHPQYKVTGKQAVELKMNNGTFDDSGSAKLNLEMEDKDSAFIGITRDGFKPTKIVVLIDKRPLYIDIPARSRFKLNVENRKSPEFAGGSNQNDGEKGGESCVELANNEQNAMIIPGTYAFHYTRKDSDRTTLFTEAEIKANVREDARKSCSFVKVYLQTDFKSYASIRGYSDAIVLVAAPDDKDY